jgi:ComF family protein
MMSRVPIPRMLAHVLDFAYPGICANCDATIGDASHLCASCDAMLDELSRAASCDPCAMPLASHGAPCPYCKGRGMPHYDRIIRLGVFDDPLKHLIHQMKYHGRWALGEFLAARLFATERAKGLLTETQVLVPVPLHFRRHVARGYNQADVIATKIARLNRRSPIIHALRRTRNTETQTHLHSHGKRIENLRNAFALRRAARHLRGKHVVVVDDVMTSGATMLEVARTLKHAEPASLCAIVLAIADPKGRGFEAI